MSPTSLSPFETSGCHQHLYVAYSDHLCEIFLGLISDNNPKIIKILPIHIFNLENPENLNSTF